MLTRFPQLLQCILGSGAHDKHGTTVNWCVGTNAASPVALGELKQRFDNSTLQGVLVLASRLDPYAENASATTSSLTAVYCNAAAASILRTVHPTTVVGGLVPASAEPGLLDAFAAACGPETLESLRELLWRVASSQQHATGGASCTFRRTASADRSQLGRERASTAAAKAPSQRSPPPPSAARGLQIETMDPAWFLLPGPDRGRSRSSSDGNDDAACRRRRRRSSGGGKAGRKGWFVRKANGGRRVGGLRCWALEEPPTPPPVPPQEQPPKGTASAASAGPCQSGGRAAAWPAVIVTFASVEDQPVGDTASPSGTNDPVPGYGGGGSGSGRLTLGASEEPAGPGLVAAAAGLVPTPTAGQGGAAGSPHGGNGGRAAASFQQDKAMRLRELLAWQFPRMDSHGAAPSAAPTVVETAAALAAAAPPPLRGSSDGSLLPLEICMDKSVRGEADALGGIVVAAAAAAAAGRLPTDGIAARPDGECSTYGSLWARRESVVLSALSHMVTAFTAGCGSVLYQNTQSVAYYGRWSPPPPEQQQQQQQQRRVPGGGGAVGDGDGGGVSGLLLLAQLFSLQPAKLERVLADVLGEGRTWRGIVQVPPSVIKPPLILFGADSGVVAAAGPADGSAVMPGGPAPSIGGDGGPQPPAGYRQLRSPLPPPPPALSSQLASVTDINCGGLLGPGATAATAAGATAGPSACRISSFPRDGIASVAVVNSPANLDADAEVHSTADTALRGAPSSMDFNPLATSTWGLMLDTSGEPSAAAMTNVTSGPVDAALTTLFHLTSRSQLHVEREVARSQSRSVVATVAVAAGGGVAPIERPASKIAFGGGGEGGGSSGTHTTSRVSLLLASSAARAPVVPSVSAARCVRSDSVLKFFASSQLQLQLQQQLQEPVQVMSQGFRHASPCPSVSSAARDSQQRGSATVGDDGSSHFGALEVVPRCKSVLVLQGSVGSGGGDAGQAGAPQLPRPRLRRCTSRVDLGLSAGAASVGPASRSTTRVLTFAGTLKNTPSALQQALAAAGAIVVSGSGRRYSALCGGGAANAASAAAARRGPSLSARSYLPLGEADAGVGRDGYACGELLPAPLPLHSAYLSSTSSSASLDELTLMPPIAALPRPPAAMAARAAPEGSAAAASGTGDDNAGDNSGGNGGWPQKRQTKSPKPRSGSAFSQRRNPSHIAADLQAAASVAVVTSCENSRGRTMEDTAASTAAAAASTAAAARAALGPIMSLASTRSDCCTATSTFPAAANPGAAVCAADSGSSRSTAALRSSKTVEFLRQLNPGATADATPAAATSANAADAAAPLPSATTVPRYISSPDQQPVGGGWSCDRRTAAAATAAAAVPLLKARSPSPPAPAVCWHEVTVVRTTDAASGLDLIVLTQADVTDKVEAERHLAKVVEAEHRLLEAIFPRHVLTYMTTEEDALQLGSPAATRSGGGRGSHRPAVTRDINKLATSHAEVTLLFADIQGFTPMCQTLEPQVVMAFLNDLFTRFDSRLEEFGVYKVETIGDCYFVAGGLIGMDEHGMPVVRARESHADPLHAEKVLMFAKAMLAAASQVSLPTTGGPVRIRIGIHSGPVVSGIVGQRMPRFCLFGDTVNTTSRMESTGVPGCIHASEAARRLLPNEDWMPTGGIEVKGKGLMNTYLWAPPGHQLHGLSLKQPPTPATAPAAAASGGSGAGAAAAGNISGHCHARDDGPVDAACHSAGGFVQIWPPLSLESVTESVAGLAELLLEEGK